MKSIAVLLLSSYLVYVLAEHDVEYLVAHGFKCGGTKEDLTNLSLFKLSDSPTSKCMYACLAKDYGIINRHGKYSKEHAKQYFKKKWNEFDSHAEVIAEKCDEHLKKFSPHHGECEYGYHVVKCLHEEMEGHHFYTPYLEKAKELHKKIAGGAYQVAEHLKHKLTEELKKFESKV